MTPTIYIDHSIVSHDPWWPSLEQAMASGRLRLALSLWNLFEIGADGDKTRQEKRLAFLEKLDPLWIIERLAIQKQEVERFLCRHKFGRDPQGVDRHSPFAVDRRRILDRLADAYRADAAPVYTRDRLRNA